MKDKMEGSESHEIFFRNEDCAIGEPYFRYSDKPRTLQMATKRQCYRTVMNSLTDLAGIIEHSKDLPKGYSIIETLKYVQQIYIHLFLINNLGKLDIDKLREEIQQREGRDFNIHHFNAAVNKVVDELGLTL